MCGIAGFAGNTRSTQEREQLALQMGNAIFHRGPDSSGIWLDDATGLSLVHRRLAIQDLSPLGYQPMHSQDDRWVLVFNGEIFNFHSLRQALLSLGHSFKGHSDTEVLLAAINQWSLIEALAKCKGQFALAIYDRQQQELHLARDRMGEKPLYYGYIDGELCFASELKALFAFSDKKLSINMDGLASYLRYGYISAPHTIFQEIQKIEPGKIITFSLHGETSGKFASKQCAYWSLEDVYRRGQQELFQNESEALAELDSTLNKVIQEQAIADVPLGAFLSGGIDSSLVAALLQANSKVPVDTFTIGFHDKEFNEAEFAKQIATHIGSNHHELYLDGKTILDVIPKLPELYDEPFADSSQIPMYLVSQMARQNVTVCLSGDGGDELFCGYNRYIETQRLLRKIHSSPPLLRKFVAAGVTSVSPEAWNNVYQGLNKIVGRQGGANTGLKIHKLAELLNTDSPANAYKFLSSYWQQPGKLLQQAAHDIPLECPLDFSERFLDAAMVWDQQWYIPGDNLVKTDRASMSVSLEMRLPLLDKDIIEFAWRTPNTMKVKNGTSKYLLRQLLYQYVPQELIDRPKMGFSVPVARWLRSDIRDWADSLLDRQLLEDQGIFNTDILLNTYQEHLRGKADHSHKLWTVLQYQAWAKTYNYL